MVDIKRLAEILLPYGTVQKGHSPQGEWPLRRSGSWQIPLDEFSILVVSEQELPPTAAELLELLLPVGGEDGQGVYRERAVRWLSGDASVTGADLAVALEKIGWPPDAVPYVVAVEAAGGERAATDLVDAVEMLRELVTASNCVIATEGSSRIYILLPWEADGAGVFHEVSGWLDTLGAELYSLFRAGVSAPAASWTSLPESRREAQFALDAGRRYQSKERVHDFTALGLARLFEGLPEAVQAQFLQEVLPDDAYSGLSAELRETVFAFLEHGQQLADTARSLYIHRNTLNYRLDRIAELTGLDVRQPLPAWTLWVALTLRRAR